MSQTLQQAAPSPVQDQGPSLPPNRLESQAYPVNQNDPEEPDGPLMPALPCESQVSHNNPDREGPQIPAPPVIKKSMSIHSEPEQHKPKQMPQQMKQPTLYLSQIQQERSQIRYSMSNIRTLRESLPLAPVPTHTSHLSSRISQVYAPSGIQRGSRLPSVRFPDGSIYDGEWKDDQPHGLGDIHLPNGSVFQGIFVNGLAVGRGRLITAEGDVYEGTINEGRAQGYGTYQSADTKTKYEGEFLNNLPHGKGRITDGVSTFQGIFRNGLRQKGRLVWGNNQEYEYEGEFNEQLFWGLGTLKSPQGIFRGWFINGKKQEKGVFTWHDGRKFEGRYANDIKNGQGILYNSDGTVCYDGTWANDLPNGYGIGYIKGKAYKGVWKHGKLQLKKTYPD